jgi:hypothetical protein
LKHNYTLNTALSCNYDFDSMQNERSDCLNAAAQGLKLQTTNLKFNDASRKYTNKAMQCLLGKTRVPYSMTHLNRILILKGSTTLACELSWGHSGVANDWT